MRLKPTPSTPSTPHRLYFLTAYRFQHAISSNSPTTTATATPTASAADH
uniref:Uncharacterized protein n=1 Tax=Rhizophora mucronata TaxID=61149 RepID=A0A2P2KJ86_RHIMU